MHRLLDDGRQRGDLRFELECIEQNGPAIAFYHSLGFRQTDQLLSYSGHPVNVVDNEPLREIDPSTVAAAVGRYGEPNLPWQISAPTLAQVTAPARAYQLGPAYALVIAPEEGPVWLRAILVETPHRRQGWGRRMLSHLAARFPDREWNVPALFPALIFTAFFHACGLQRAHISQARLELELATPTERVA
jgi:GNAT superfamily N-acetyltransferase